MYAETKNDWFLNPLLSAEVMTSIEARIAAEKPDLSIGLIRLRKLLGDEKFEKYICQLQNIAKKEELLLVIADNVLQRALIERNCIPQLKEAFGVSMVKVVG
jgi:hypothetical protein